MRVLFITQKVDQKDSVLGIYHEWIRALGAQVERLFVITLFLGHHELPQNVVVKSLGKEEGGPSFLKKLRYSLRFYKALWNFRAGYDSVFVHMNKEYVLLGAFLWKLSGKKIIFWYNHPHGDWMSRLAIALADTVLYTSSSSYAARSAHAVQMPVGVLVPEVLQPHVRHDPFEIISIGRISPVKRVHEMVESFQLLPKQIPARLTIYGDPVPREEDLVYARKVLALAKTVGDRIAIQSGIPHAEIVDYFSNADLSLNLTETGSMDKTLFESCAAGTPFVTTNQAVRAMLPSSCANLLVAEEHNLGEIAAKIEGMCELSEEEYQRIRKDLFEWVQKEHSLSALLRKLLPLF